MLNLAHGQHLAQHFGDFNGSSTHQDGASGFYHLLNLFDDGFIFFAFGFVNAVVHVITGNGAVGRDNDYIQFVDVPKLARFRFGGTGHTGQLVIHTEVILQGNRGKCLCGGFHLHAFFGFNGLVQTVGVAAALHDTSGLFVHNLHLAVDYYIFVVFLEHGVSLQQLVDGMYTLALDGEVCHKGIFLGKAFLVCQFLFIFQFGELGGDVGKHEERGVFGVAANQVYALVGQVYAVQFFFNHEIQRVGNLVHTLVVLLHVDFLGLEHTGFDALLAEELNQRLVLGQALVTAVQGKEALFLFFLVIRSNQAFGIGKVLRSQLLLCFYQTFHLRTELLEELVVAFGNRAGDNQRSTGVVNQYRVYLIDDGIIVLTLYKVFRADSHIVTQVVEAEFVVRTESDVGKISLAACVGVGLVSVDAIHAQAVEHIERAHPFGVTFCQIVVHGYYVHAVSGQCVEEYGQGGHQGLTFTGCHFRNLAFV